MFNAGDTSEIIPETNQAPSTSNVETIKSTPSSSSKELSRRTIFKKKMVIVKSKPQIDPLARMKAHLEILNNGKEPDEVLTNSKIQNDLNPNEMEASTIEARQTVEAVSIKKNKGTVHEMEENRNMKMSTTKKSKPQDESQTNKEMFINKDVDITNENPQRRITIESEFAGFSRTRFESTTNKETIEDPIRYEIESRRIITSDLIISNKFVELYNEHVKPISEFEYCIRIYFFSIHISAFFLQRYGCNFIDLLHNISRIACADHDNFPIILLIRGLLKYGGNRGKFILFESLSDNISRERRVIFDLKQVPNDVEYIIQYNHMIDIFGELLSINNIKSYYPPFYFVPHLKRIITDPVFVIVTKNYNNYFYHRDVLFPLFGHAQKLNFNNIHFVTINTKYIRPLNDITSRKLLLVKPFHISDNVLKVDVYLEISL